MKVQVADWPSICTVWAVETGMGLPPELMTTGLSTEKSSIRTEASRVGTESSSVAKRDGKWDRVGFVFTESRMGGIVEAPKSETIEEIG